MRTNRHPAADEIERDFILFPPFFGHFAQVERLGAVNDSAVEQVFETGLEKAVEVGVFEHSSAVAASQIDMPD
ncbi:MAG: hypothetical protein QHJ82_08970 [Verrucomicrobiota bacterium]|nr:hypothetical protein [Verrucomicrobiota bacterium]